MIIIENILDTIKKTIGLSVNDSSFDVDVIMFINTSLTILSQLGISEANENPIIDEHTTWDELLGGRVDLEIIKTYIHFKTKLMFDPPTNSAATEAMNRTISELEWRITNLELNKGVIINE